MDAMNKKKVMSKYEIERVIGSGNFGTVYLIKLNGGFYALKEVNMNKLKPLERQRAFNEVILLAKLNHRYIIKYKDSSIDHINGKLFIITDYADCGDLSSAIVKQKGYPFTQTTIILWFLQICLALQYIHSQNILHRDLKTQNIFLCKDKTIKVGDFGIARLLDNSQDFTNTAIGTPYYFSPEICLKKPYNNKSDMWALGCVLFEMTTLTYPFKADNFPQLMSVILERKLSPFPSWCSKLAKSLVEILLCTDPDKRPSTDQVLAYPPLQHYLSYIEKPNKTSFPVEVTHRNLKDSGKRNASTSSSNSSKVPKISPKIKENEKKPYTVMTRVIPPTIVVTEYQTPKRNYETEKKGPLALAQATSSAIVNKRKIMENERKPRSSSIQAISSPSSASYNKVENKSIENEPKPRSTSTRSIIAIDNETDNKLRQNEFKGDFAISLSPSEYKATRKFLNSKPLIESRGNANSTYIVTKEKNGGMNPSEIQSKSIPNEIDCGYSSEEINCSADSTNNSICDHSITGSENEFSILKNKEHDEKSIDQSHCVHYSQCQPCMIEMMWKSRIRGCLSIKGSNRDYLKLKDKLLSIFQPPDLFQKIYESLLNEWEGNENYQSHSAIRNFAKILNYEQVQHLPLMIQLVQLDFVKLSKDGTYTRSDELVML